MLDGLSFDQLRTFIAAAEAGSFSSAGRRLQRAQSVVSQTIANLEGQLGIALFDRQGRYPLLTEAGKILLADARGLVRGLDGFRARAKGMASGLEPELSVVFDVMFPMAVLTRVAAAFRETFPMTPFRLYVEALGGVAQAVLNGQCQLGVMGSLTVQRPELAVERLLGVRMIMVAAPSHPLAQTPGRLRCCALSEHVQLVLTDRTELSRDQEFAVMSTQTWRLADLGAKHAFLLAGLGWGGMPYPMIADDLAAGRLCALEIEDQPAEGLIMPMSATYRTAAPPGPAGRWLIEQLREMPADEDGAPVSAEDPRPRQRLDNGSVPGTGFASDRG